MAAPIYNDGKEVAEEVNYHGSSGSNGKSGQLLILKQGEPCIVGEWGVMVFQR